MADNVIAVIPARGGSKGIYKKNIRDVCGRPLIYYQLRNAVLADRVDRVVLATDDPRIADIGRQMFPEEIDVVIRPPEISHDRSKTEETLVYVLDELYRAGDDYEIVVTLEPTNPLNRPEYVQGLVRLVSDEGFDSACCVIDDYGFFLDSPDDHARLLQRPMRQDIVPRLRETGNGWATRTDALRWEKNRLAGRIGHFSIPEADSYHLDDNSDWRIIEALLGPRVNAPRGRYFREKKGTHRADAYGADYWKGVVDPDGVVRDRTKEREKRLRECNQELEYLKKLRPGRVLDVGCGLGFFLSGISDDWDKHGVEVSPFAAECARVYGDIFCGELSHAAYDSDCFDVVVLYHVIEHLTDPVDMIKEIHRILKPGGKLVVGTPDFESGLAQRFGEKFRLLHDASHIRLFSARSLCRMLTDFQFAIESVSRPFFDTEHFTIENLTRLFDTSQTSPPFYGNVVTVYCYKK